MNPASATNNANDLGKAGEDKTRDSHDAERAKKLVEAIAILIAPTALLTGLLYYFGWVRTRQYWATFGIENSLLDFSVQDYLLRGIDAVHLPLVIILSVFLLSVWAVQIAAARLPAHSLRARRALTAALGFVGGLCLLLGLLGVSREGAVWSRSTSLWLTVAIMALGALGLVVRTYVSVTRVHGSLLAPVSVALLSMLMLLTIFWLFANYAGTVGRNQARARLSNIDRRGEIVLYSTEDLRIDPTYATTSNLGTDGKYRFRYGGLKLLLRTENHYFLLPNNWMPGDPSLVVPVADAPRIDIVARE